MVSHHGRSAPKLVVYEAPRGNHGIMFPMVILVGFQSAAASEIVAGALEGYDRARAMATPILGEGRVQTADSLAQTSGLALTTACYSTPSGLLLQRSYVNVSLYDYCSDPSDERPWAFAGYRGSFARTSTSLIQAS